MNSKVIGLIVVVIIAAISLGGFFIVNQENSSSIDTPEQSSTDNSREGLNEENISPEEDLSPEGVDFFQGEITEVDTSNNSLVISSEDDENLTITYTEETFFEPFGGDIESIADLQEGDYIDGQGEQTDDTLEAEEIFVLPSGNFPGEEPIEPESGSVEPGSELPENSEEGGAQDNNVEDLPVAE